MWSIIGHRIDYNAVGALRGQRHIPGNKFRDTRLLDITGVTVPFSEGEYILSTGQLKTWKNWGSPPRTVTDIKTFLRQLQ